jgi:hypothetical protein
MPVAPKEIEPASPPGWLLGEGVIASPQTSQ